MPFLLTADTRLCVFSLLKTVLAGIEPATNRSNTIALPTELQQTYNDERVPVVTYLSVPNATHHLRSHRCY